MLIQNVNNMVQAQPPVRLVGNGAVVAAPSNIEAKPSVPLELPQTAAKQVAEQQPSAAQLQHVVDNINKVMKQSDRNLEFTVDTDTKKPIVKLVDTETGELIRQIPSEETLAIARSIDRFQQGLLLRQKA